MILIIIQQIPMRIWSSERKRMPYAYLHDATQEVATAWGAQRTPEFYLLDAEGKVTYHGRMDDSPRPNKAYNE